MLRAAPARQEAHSQYLWSYRAPPARCRALTVPAVFSRDGSPATYCSPGIAAFTSCAGHLAYRTRFAGLGCRPHTSGHQHHFRIPAILHERSRSLPETSVKPALRAESSAVWGAAPARAPGIDAGRRPPSRFARSRRHCAKTERACPVANTCQTRGRVFMRVGWPGQDDALYSRSRRCTQG